VSCAHHHLIFTIDHELNALWMLNTPAMMTALFGAVRDTLQELLGDRKYLGAQPGILLALHTWGRSLSLHPHIHAWVSDGGWSEERGWVTPRRGGFLPHTVVMMLFRGKLLWAIRRLHEMGTLRCPEQMSPERLRTLLNRSGRKRLSRVLMHAPERGLHTVRYYGLYAPACREALNHARAAHGQAPGEAIEPIEWQVFLARFSNAGALLASRCVSMATEFSPVW
jgi:Putative transposase